MPVNRERTVEMGQTHTEAGNVNVSRATLMRQNRRREDEVILLASNPFTVPAGAYGRRSLRERTGGDDGPVHSRYTATTKNSMFLVFFSQSTQAAQLKAGWTLGDNPNSRNGRESRN